MMERLKESKVVYILLSVLLAVVFWLYVRAELDPTQPTPLRNVRVELTGTSVLARQGLAVAGLSDTTVDLRVEAPLSVLDSLNRYRGDIWVVLDVSKCVEGENRLSYTPHFPENINRENITTQERNPGIIVVTVEKLEQKSFEIGFRLNGQVAQGYQAGTPAIQPETVTVSGPIDQVNQVAQVVAILENSNLEERFTGDLPLKLLDSNGEELTGLEVTMDTSTAYVMLPVVVVKEIPLSVNVIDGGGATAENAVIDIDPKSIVVSGAEEELEGLEELSLGPINLAEVVGTRVFPMSITLNPSLENISGNTMASVTVTINGLATRTFDVENISLTGLSNIPQRYTVDLLTQVKAVTVRGREEDLAAIDASQIRIVADVSDFTNQGTYTIPARVHLNAGGAVGVVNDYTVTVSISG